MTETVVFNVGGKEYKVAKSLLQQYPDCMLARMISEEWQQQRADEKLFIERDGERFGHVLDYLRDGCVTLPSSVSKDALLQDLEYYGLPVNKDIKMGGLGKSFGCAFSEIVALRYKSLYFQFMSACVDMGGKKGKMSFILPRDKKDVCVEIIEIPDHIESINSLFCEYGLKVITFEKSKNDRDSYNVNLTTILERQDNKNESEFLMVLKETGCNMAKTVVFNVGGKNYEVAKSLLQQYPDCRLTRIICEDWNQHEKTKLFIERDGERFRYVLDYLRDGRLSLPVTVSKDALLKDLEYYGLQVNNNIETDSFAKNLLPFALDENTTLRNKSLYLQFVSECVGIIFTSKSMSFDLPKDKQNVLVWEGILKISDHIEGLNKLFSEYGFKVTTFRHHRNYDCSQYYVTLERL
eukprot:CAMPEP_0194307088 /NCGR_PEP_ID=MMETSP0171-20130528/3973_1 /TAXON_ID=218684 /ORGANISM="Corethron pennatum, Strain L29A3" /LENGTH=407 /DNA_ID=CAMNT_0039058977 /DNA_START=65 /DNA_END=1288 /DNA_ORIENTATION=+